MQLGVVFPQNEIGADPLGIRDYAQTVEGLDYSHLAVYDHVVGADPTNRPGWQGRRESPPGPVRGEGRVDPRGGLEGDRRERRRNNRPDPVA